MKISTDKILLRKLCPCKKLCENFINLHLFFMKTILRTKFYLSYCPLTNKFLLKHWILVIKTFKKKMFLQVVNNWSWLMYKMCNKTLFLSQLCYKSSLGKKEHLIIHKLKVRNYRKWERRKHLNNLAENGCLKIWGFNYLIYENIFFSIYACITVGYIPRKLKQTSLIHVLSLRLHCCYFFPDICAYKDVVTETK